MKRNILVTIGAFATFFLGTAFFVQAEEQAGDWFTEGERLHYNVYVWGWAKAGEAELLYLPMPDQHYRAIGRAWTNTSLFKMRDRLRVEGSILPENGKLQTIEQNVELHENKRVSLRRTRFDHRQNQLSFQNMRHPEEAPKVAAMQKEAVDLYSALLSLRHTVKGAKPGDVFTLPMGYKDENFDLVVKIEKRVPAMRGHTGHWLYVRPYIYPLDAAFKRKEGEVNSDWHIWVSDDAHYRPMQIEVSTKFGDFRAVLQSVGGVDTPTQAPKGLDAWPNEAETRALEKNMKNKGTFANPL